MYEPIMVPPRRPRRTLRTVLIVAGVVLGLCCVGGIVAGALLINAGRNELPRIQSDAVAYFDDVRAGDMAAAYGYLCDAVRSRVPEETFAAESRQPRDYRITGVRISNVNGRTRGFVSVHVVMTDGQSLDQVFTLVKEHGSWRICDPE